MFYYISDIEPIIKNNDNKPPCSVLDAIDKIIYNISSDEIKEYFARDIEKYINFNTFIRAILTNIKRDTIDYSSAIKSIQNIEYSIDRYKSNRLKLRLYHNDENY